MKVWIIVVALLALTVPVAAQTAPVTSVVVKVFNQGAPLPISTSFLPIANWVCNLAPAVDTSNGANPFKIQLEDPGLPAGSGKVCIFTDLGPGPLLTLPFGTGIYDAVADFVNAAGTSPDSPRSNPFTRPGAVAPVPTGLRVYR